MDKSKNKEYTIKEAANLIGRTVWTLQQWDRKGQLSPKRTKGGQRRYSQADIEAGKTIALKKAGLSETPSIQSIENKLKQAQSLIDEVLVDLAKISP